MNMLANTIIIPFGYEDILFVIYAALFSYAGKLRLSQSVV